MCSSDLSSGMNVGDPRSISSGHPHSCLKTHFFQDMFTTSIGEGEILTEVRVPKHTGWGAHYEKFSRVAQQWSIVAVAATVRVESGTIAQARVAMTNMGSCPIRASSTEQALLGVAVDGPSIAAAVAGIAEGTRPPSRAC